MEERLTKIIHINAQSLRNKIDDLTAESGEYDVKCTLISGKDKLSEVNCFKSKIEMKTRDRMRAQ